MSEIKDCDKRKFLISDDFYELEQYNFEKYVKETKGDKILKAIKTCCDMVREEYCCPVIPNQVLAIALPLVKSVGVRKHIDTLKDSIIDQPDPQKLLELFAKAICDIGYCKEFFE